MIADCPIASLHSHLNTIIGFTHKDRPGFKSLHLRAYEIKIVPLSFNVHVSFHCGTLLFLSQSVQTGPHGSSSHKYDSMELVKHGL